MNIRFEQKKLYHESMDLFPSQLDSSPRMVLHGFTLARLTVLTPIRIRCVPDCVTTFAPLVCVTCESASMELQTAAGKPKVQGPAVCLLMAGQPVRNFCSRQRFSRQPRTP